MTEALLWHVKLYCGVEKAVDLKQLSAWPWMHRMCRLPTTLLHLVRRDGAQSVAVSNAGRSRTASA